MRRAPARRRRRPARPRRRRRGGAGRARRARPGRRRRARPASGPAAPAWPPCCSRGRGAEVTLARARWHDDAAGAAAARAARRRRRRAPRPRADAGHPRADPGAARAASRCVRLDDRAPGARAGRRRRRRRARGGDPRTPTRCSSPTTAAASPRTPRVREVLAPLGAAPRRSSGTRIRAAPSRCPASRPPPRTGARPCASPAPPGAATSTPAAAQLRERWQAARRRRHRRGARRRGDAARREPAAARRPRRTRAPATPAAPATGSRARRPLALAARRASSPRRSARPCSTSPPGWTPAASPRSRPRCAGRAASPPPAPGRRPTLVAARPRPRGGTVVATGGCFDVLHAGHVATPRGGPPARRLPGRAAELRRQRHPAQGPGTAACTPRRTAPACSLGARLRRRRRRLRRGQPARRAGAAAARRLGQGRRLRRRRRCPRRRSSAPGAAGWSSCRTCRAAPPPGITGSQRRQTRHDRHGSADIEGTPLDGPVLVTGGSSGLGAAVVAAVAKRGGRAVVLDRQAAAPRSRTPSSCRSTSPTPRAAVAAVEQAVAAGRRPSRGRHRRGHGRLRQARRRRRSTPGRGSCRSTCSAPPPSSGPRCRTCAPTRGRVVTVASTLGHQGGLGRDRLLRVEVRRRRVHPGARRRDRRRGRRHPADPGRHDDALLRRPHRAVQAGAGRRAQRPGARRRGDPLRAVASRRGASCASSSSPSPRRPPGRDRTVGRRDRPRPAPRPAGAGPRATPLTGVPALRGLRRAFPGRRLLLAAAGEPAELLRACGVVDAVVPTPGSTARRRARVSDRTSRSTCTAAVRRATACCRRRAAPHRRVRLPGGRRRRAAAGTRPSTRSGAGAGSSTPPRCAPCAGRVCRPDDLRLQSPTRTPPTVGRGSRVRRPAPRRLLRRPALAGPPLGPRWPPRWRPPACPSSSPAARTSARLVAGVAAAGGCRRDRCTAGELALPALARWSPAPRCSSAATPASPTSGTALGTPSVLLFGPVPPSRWGPLADPELHTVLWHRLRPRGRAADPSRRACDPALLRIGVDDVLHAASTAVGARVSVGTATA